MEKEHILDIPKLEDLTHEILPEEYPNYDLTFKIIVIGDAFVGKSCLTSKGTKNSFDPSYSATVGFEFLHTNIKVEDKVCKLQIWDTCGQEVYRSLITNFYRNSTLAILVYSIDNPESFENVDLWLKELKTFSSPDAKVFLIGNKADLEDSRKVDKRQGEQFKQDHDLDFFIETSAKSGYNAQKVFVEAAKILYLDHIQYKDRYRANSLNSVSSVGSTKSNGVPFNKVNIQESNDSTVKKSSCSC